MDIFHHFQTSYSPKNASLYWQKEIVSTSTAKNLAGGQIIVFRAKLNLNLGDLKSIVLPNLVTFLLSCSCVSMKSQFQISDRHSGILPSVSKPFTENAQTDSDLFRPCRCSFRWKTQHLVSFPCQLNRRELLISSHLPERMLMLMLESPQRRVDRANNETLKSKVHWNLYEAYCSWNNPLLSILPTQTHRTVCVFTDTVPNHVWTQMRQLLVCQ